MAFVGHITQNYNRCLLQTSMREHTSLKRVLKIRFREHLHDFKQRNGKSRFAQHLIDNGHSIGRMEDMETLQITSNGKMMGTF